MIELALLLPFLILIIVFVMEFGVALYTWVSVNNAASEAARYAAVANASDVGACNLGTPGSVEARAVQAANGIITCDEVFVSYENIGGFPDIERGDSVVVRIEHQYTTVTAINGFLNWVTGGSIGTTWTLAACADARLEQAPTGIIAPGTDCGS